MLPAEININIKEYIFHKIANGKHKKLNTEVLNFNLVMLELPKYERLGLGHYEIVKDNGRYFKICFEKTELRKMLARTYQILR